jgi:hypothetical protein
MAKRTAVASGHGSRLAALAPHHEVGVNPSNWRISKLIVYYAFIAPRNQSSICRGHKGTMREWFWIGVVLVVAVGWDIHSFNGRVTSYAISMASSAIPAHR